MKVKFIFHHKSLMNVSVILSIKNSKILLPSLSKNKISFEIRKNGNRIQNFGSWLKVVFQMEDTNLDF